MVAEEKIRKAGETAERAGVLAEKVVTDTAQGLLGKSAIALMTILSVVLLIIAGVLLRSSWLFVLVDIIMILFVLVLSFRIFTRAEH